MFLEKKKNVLCYFMFFVRQYYLCIDFEDENFHGLLSTNFERFVRKKNKIEFFVNVNFLFMKAELRELLKAFVTVPFCWVTWSHPRMEVYPFILVFIFFRLCRPLGKYKLSFFMESRNQYSRQATFTRRLSDSILSLFFHGFTLYEIIFHMIFSGLNTV